MDMPDRKCAAPVPQGKRRQGLFTRFRQDGKGSIAIEFGVLALPFFLLIFAILESSISFAAQQLMSNVTDDVARQFRTGQLKSADTTEEPLRDMICSDLEIVVTSGCPGLEIDLKRYDTFAEAAGKRIAFKEGDIDTTGFSVQPGQSLS